MMIKKISALFAALCMVLSVSCAKSSSDEETSGKKADSTKTEYTSEEGKAIADMQRFVDNIIALSEAYNDKLFDETVDLYISNGKNPLLANLSEKMQKEFNKKFDVIRKNEKYRLTLSSVVEVAQAKMAREAEAESDTSDS